MYKWVGAWLCATCVPILEIYLGICSVSCLNELSYIVYRSSLLLFRTHCGHPHNNRITTIISEYVTQSIIHIKRYTTWIIYTFNVWY